MTTETDHTRLLSVDYVGAYYIRGTGKLTIFVCGVTAITTTDIRIEEVESLGALKFRIVGEMPHWGGFQFYTASFTKEIKDLPNPALPGDIVLVEDAETPGGQQVTVKFYGPLGQNVPS
jgi:hypothetical protein